MFMNENEFYELTNPQQNIWNMGHFFANTTIDTIPANIIINEPINEFLLKQSIYNVIQKNDSFRIKITLNNGVPVQQVCAFEPFDIDIIHI